MRSRALGWASTIALVTAAGVLYAPVVAGMVRQWYDEPESSHGLLLAAAAVFVALRRRPRLRATAAAPSDAGFVLLALAFVAYLLGSLVGDLFVIRLSMPLALAGGIVVLWGTAHARVLASALGLLLLAI